MTSWREAGRVRAVGPALRAAARSWSGWGPRRHLLALGSAVATVAVVAVPTALLPNPVFGREVPPTAWAWPVLLVTAALSGLLVGTYVRDAPLRGPGRTDPAPGSAPGAADPAQARAGAVGGLLTFFAVGCPVCNKLALLALGYTGALQWFAPVQPWLAAAAIVLLGWALVRRLQNDGACPVPRSTSPTGVGR